MTLSITSKGLFSSITGTASPVTSASITPTANTLYVLATTCDWDFASTNTGTLTPTDTFGDTGGTSWALVPTCVRSPVSSGQGRLHSEIWWRTIGTGPSAGTISIAFSPNPAATARYLMGAPYEITGFNAASPIGTSTGSTNRQTAGPTTFTDALGAAPATTSLVLAVLYQDNTLTLATVPSGFTQIDSDAPSGFGSCNAIAYQNAGSPSQNPQWTNCDTASNMASAAIEVQAAASPTALSMLRVGPGPWRTETIEIRKGITIGTPPATPPTSPMPLQALPRAWQTPNVEIRKGITIGTPPAIPPPVARGNIGVMLPPPLPSAKIIPPAFTPVAAVVPPIAIVTTGTLVAPRSPTALIEQGLPDPQVETVPVPILIKAVQKIPPMPLANVVFGWPDPLIETVPVPVDLVASQKPPPLPQADILTQPLYDPIVETVPVPINLVALQKIPPLPSALVEMGQPDQLVETVPVPIELVALQKLPPVPTALIELGLFDPTVESVPVPVQLSSVVRAPSSPLASIALGPFQPPVNLGGSWVPELVASMLPTPKGNIVLAPGITIGTPPVTVTFVGFLTATMLQPGWASAVIEQGLFDPFVETVPVVPPLIGKQIPQGVLSATIDLGFHDPIVETTPLALTVEPTRADLTRAVVYFQQVPVQPAVITAYRLDLRSQVVPLGQLLLRRGIEPGLFPPPPSLLPGTVVSSVTPLGLVVVQIVPFGTVTSSIMVLGTASGSVARNEVVSSVTPLFGVKGAITQ